MKQFTTIFATPFIYVGLILLLATPFCSTSFAQGIKDLEGTINVDGSSTVAPITIQADASFRDKCPKVKVPVGVSGTGGGFKRFTQGQTDISDASRPIKFNEFQTCRRTASNSTSFRLLTMASRSLSPRTTISSRR